MATDYSGFFQVADGPVSPDHIVYSKSQAYRGALKSASIHAFQAEYGYLPKVVVSDSGVFGVAATLKQAGLALELARDGALVCQLAQAFGGIQFMSDRARLFIENWEVESYRQKIADKP
jgi:rhamnose utilization protein RhaD (predicted bifunctional aldolase and dehydrogenase)